MRAGLHQHGGIVQCLFAGGVSHEGQVDEDQRTLVAAFDAGGVVGHIGDADRQGAVMPLQHHAEGIADQQHVDAGLAGGLGESGVIAGQHGDLLAALLEALQGGQGNVRHENRPHSGVQQAAGAASIWPALASVCTGAGQRDAYSPDGGA
ncbi:hypothetical protein D9M68_907950 [compost metagenome]